MHIHPHLRSSFRNCSTCRCQEWAASPNPKLRISGALGATTFGPRWLCACWWMSVWAHIWMCACVCVRVCVRMRICALSPFTPRSPLTLALILHITRHHSCRHTASTLSSRTAPATAWRRANAQRYSCWTMARTGPFWPTAHAPPTWDPGIRVVSLLCRRCCLLNYL